MNDCRAWHCCHFGRLRQVKIAVTCMQVIILLLTAGAASTECKESAAKVFTCPYLQWRVTRSDGTASILVHSTGAALGSIIRAEDMILISILESKCPADAVDDVRTLEGRVLRRSLAKGDCIRLQDIGIELLPGCPSKVTYLGQENILLPVLFAAKNFDKGHCILYSDLTLKAVRFNKIPPHALVSPYSAYKRISANHVKSGQMLFEWNIGVGVNEPE